MLIGNYIYLQKNDGQKQSQEFAKIHSIKMTIALGSILRSVLVKTGGCHERLRNHQAAVQANTNLISMFEGNYSWILITM